MTLDPGTLSLTIEYTKDLKDRDWICRQDPYCNFRVGQHTRRSKTAKSGGRNPVFNETFHFGLKNENTVEIEIKDDNILSDEYIGSCAFNLAKARESGSDFVNVPVTSKHCGKQHGFIAVALQWTRNGALASGPKPNAITAAAAVPAAGVPTAPVVATPLNAPPPSFVAAANLYAQLAVPPPLQPQPYPSATPYPTPPAPCYPQGPQYTQPYGMPGAGYGPAVQQPYTANYVAMAPATGYNVPAVVPQYAVRAAPPPPVAPTVIFVEADDFPFGHHHHHRHRHRHHRRGSDEERVVIIEEVL